MYIDASFVHICQLSFWKIKRKAEGLGNDNQKIMIKVKTIGQMLLFKNGTALPSPSQAPG